MAKLSERIIGEGLTFGDVLLVPAFSEVLPREVSLASSFSKNIRLAVPFASAAMDTVTETVMAMAIASEGGIGVIHKNLSVEKQAAEVAAVKAAGCVVAAAVGVGQEAIERAEALVRAGVDAIVVDSAHGHSKGVIETVKALKARFSVDIVAGNIATAEGALALVEAGADAVKVGIGPGSICTTRIVAGVGVPQLTAVAEVAEALEGSGVPVIADGGIRYSGDIVKALAAGADCVMCGNLFAGTDEAPGEIEEVDGVRWKAYRGMGSTDAMMAGSADRYFQKDQKKLVPEGVVARTPYKGRLADVVFQLAGGLRAGMGYVGAPDIPSLRNARFVKITAAGSAESFTHDVTIAKPSPNYR